eukprot:TRINITY_DN271_c0_g2_i1.p1 TRINITY_DN271_c0_g2~~TRINITY_DN271_c0_g2_i1.p1  ORF type:complete len:173 (+),score=36.33 TRINITY_DN271_c0_g2_i1:93-611(+)
MLSFTRHPLLHTTTLQRNKDKKKKKAAPQVDVKELRKAHEKTEADLKRHADFLRDPKPGSLPLRPHRTVEEYKEARVMRYLYDTKVQDAWRRMIQSENMMMKRRELAIEMLPERFQTQARENDLAPYPMDMIVPRNFPPLEDVEIFGEFQLPGNGNNYYPVFQKRKGLFDTE